MVFGKNSLSRSALILLFGLAGSTLAYSQDATGAAAATGNSANTIEDRIDFTDEYLDKLVSWDYDTVKELENDNIMYVSPVEDIQQVILREGVPGVHLSLPVHSYSSKYLLAIFSKLCEEYNLPSDEFRMYISEYDSPIVGNVMLVNEVEESIMKDNGTFETQFPQWAFYKLDENNRPVREKNVHYGGPMSLDLVNDAADNIEIIYNLFFN